MTHDIFVQDLPPGIASVSDIPSDFRPGPIGQRRAVIETIKAIAPYADFSNPSWGVLAKEGDFHIEVNLGESENLNSFAFHVAGGVDAEQLVGRILGTLNLRALDPRSESGLFRSPDH